jgi:two-component system phosphate regulon sensor histidine kinase PhoR
MKRHLFYKIFGSYLVIVALSFLVLNLFVRDEIRKMMIGQIEEQFLTYARLIDLNEPQDISRQLKQITQISGARITLIDAQGRVFGDSEKEPAGLDSHFNRPEVQEARVRGKGKSVRFSKSIGTDMLYVAVPIKDGAAIKGYVRLARPLYDVRNAVEKTYNSFFLALFIIAICSLIIAIIFSYRLTAPIKLMERFTERLRQGHPAGTIILKTTDETKKLADNINYLVDELQNKITLANEEKSKLMAAFTSMTEGALILAADEKIEFVSPALANILTGQYGDMVGRTLIEAFRNIELQEAFQKFKESQAAVSREITLGGLDPVIMSVTISPVSGSAGIGKAMIVFHDVTRLKKLEKTRIDFVANVTHEIRTPLTAIIGYLETIQAGTFENANATKRFVDIVLKQAQRLNRLVEDLMTISKIELGEINFHFEDIVLQDVLAGVLPLAQPKAKLKNISLNNMVAAESTPVRADRDRLSQVFVNILDNAVKFTPENGTITISANEESDFIIVKVIDSGIGIPRNEIERLGERFYRVDKTRSRELGGTGLGLSIAKHLMIAHGGKMEIESRLGYGTTVSLFFPLKKINFKT